MTDESKPTPIPTETAEFTQAALDIPLHRFLGLELVSQEPGRARARFSAGPQTLNIVGAMHGGVAYALLDVVCYAALLPLLGKGEHAVTHELHVSVIRPVLADQEVELRGRVLQKGRSLAFCESEAWVAGKLVAAARVTKSLVRRKPAQP